MSRTGLLYLLANSISQSKPHLINQKFIHKPFRQIHHIFDQTTHILIYRNNYEVKLTLGRVKITHRCDVQYEWNDIVIIAGSSLVWNQLINVFGVYDGDVCIFACKFHQYWVMVGKGRIDVPVVVSDPLTMLIDMANWYDGNKNIWDSPN